MKLIRTVDSAGHILCHDMTRIVPGEVKETRFRKGHIIKADDIPVLLDMGKESLYVWEQAPGKLHEEEAAEKLRVVCQGENLRAAPVREGKIELFAHIPGLLKINSEKVYALNNIGDVAIMTARGNRGIQEEEKAAALKAIPLLIDEEKIRCAEEICGGEKIINVIPYRQKKVGLIITGSEVYNHRIPDTGSAIVRKKIEAFPVESVQTILLEDDPEKITAAINAMIGLGCGLVICTGGMSVDPDDKTPLAIKNTGARIVTYGVPLMPGTMLMLAYHEKGGVSIPLIGAPACVFYEHTTALDILLPRLMADDIILREELAMLGEGGIVTN